MQPELPLSGTIAIEIGHSVAIPFCGQILATLGATLIKVEHPERGDDARKWGPPFWHGTSSLFQALNRDKLGVTVDLKDPASRDRLRKVIVERADIVVQNLRPGVVETLGLDAASIRALNPKLIYCSLSGFGAEGPLRNRPGYDPLMQAFGGIMSITGEEGRAPVRVGPSIIDMGSGMWAALGIVAALRRRELTGEGCEVEGSLFETAVTWMNMTAAAYFASGNVPGRIGSEAPFACPYNAYKTADGYIIIAAGNDRLFRLLADVLGHPEWAGDAHYLTNADRVKNRVALNGLIAAIVETQPKAHWLEQLEKAGVPCAQLQSINEVVEHEQTIALGMLQNTPEQAMPLIGLPLRFNRTRPPCRHDPPTLGQHNAILDELCGDTAAAG
ncbi:CaiB/BaiF CoA-transferase family protein [Bosea sp. (in: a-proteobacteria)]|uniref:CaiB/BaiF CoA transferase family protein n=1 Tax=Bosea sp. (in: a-proteobacteria) TaxID=1871050 RepID=UPI002614C49B|nr:CoA transferase [Bosea sp. (in: a-proteobacteria)]MCO5090212.1 CoA transferase [Bosea sp. (in: a-proteobacteria)]